MGKTHRTERRRIDARSVHVLGVAVLRGMAAQLLYVQERWEEEL
jgi:hypothetical protein